MLSYLSFDGGAQLHLLEMRMWLSVAKASEPKLAEIAFFLGKAQPVRARDVEVAENGALRGK